MRRGIRLIECIVVLAVVGLSAALLLPAVAAARAGAREETCLNNLKQIGLAIHNYESANGSFPMSNVVGPGHGTGHSAFVAILPYMQLAPVYNAYNFSVENWSVINTTVGRTTIASFLCPENEIRDPVPAKEVITMDDKPLPEGDVFGRVHYGANWGGGHKGFGDDFLKERGTLRGMIIPVAVKDDNGRPTRNVRLADVTDGTSFTLAFVEKRSGSGWAIGGWGGVEFDVNTVVNYEGDDSKSRRVFTGASHETGPNALLGDGSARPLSPKLDRKVWYNLITRNGGEVINPEDF